MIKIKLCVLFLSCVATVSQAQVYRWVDQNGNVNYTQSPPPSGESETVKLHKLPEGVTENAQEELEKLRRQQAEEEKAQQVKRQNESNAAAAADLQKRNCENARKNFAKLERQGLRLRSTVDGQAVVLSDDERLERQKQAQENIEKYCNP